MPRPLPFEVIFVPLKGLPVSEGKAPTPPIGNPGGGVKSKPNEGIANVGITARAVRGAVISLIRGVVADTDIVLTEEDVSGAVVGSRAKPGSSIGSTPSGRVRESEEPGVRPMPNS